MNDLKTIDPLPEVWSGCPPGYCDHEDECPAGYCYRRDAEQEEAQAQHEAQLARMDRWAAMSDREREDEIRRAMQ